MQAFAEERGAIAVVAEELGGLVGFVIVHLERVGAGWRGYVVTLDVAEEWRRRGLAGMLMREAEARVAAAAIRFYERLGYERIGMIQRFYGAAGLDAFVYRREIADR